MDEIKIEVPEHYCYEESLYALGSRCPCFNCEEGTGYCNNFEKRLEIERTAIGEHPIDHSAIYRILYVRLDECKEKTIMEDWNDY